MGFHQDRFLSGRTALVTGAGRGIGAAIARELAALGAKLILVGRTESRLKMVARQIETEGGIATSVVADVGVNDWLQALLHQEQQIDILVHAASAFAPYGPLEERTPEEINTVLDTNLGAALRMSAALLPGMKSRGFGMFVFIGSLAGSLGAINQVVYATAKSGFSGLVKSLVVENAEYGINAHLLELGLFDTERTREAMSDSARERIVSRTPAGRIGQTADVVAAVRYLLSPDAQFLRGITLPITGGVGLGVIPPKAKPRTP